jgi:hypothetical protein
MTDTQEEIVPRLGQHISTGVLIAYTPRQTRYEGGMYPHGVGLLLLPLNDFHHYVVWNIYTTDVGGTKAFGEVWVAESGNYYEDIEHATKGYLMRCGYNA